MISFLEALHLSGTPSLKTGTRPPSCHIPRQPSIYATIDTIGMPDYLGHFGDYDFIRKVPLEVVLP